MWFRNELSSSLHFALFILKCLSLCLLIFLFFSFLIHLFSLVFFFPFLPKFFHIYVSFSSPAPLSSRSLFFYPPPSVIWYTTSISFLKGAQCCYFCFMQTAFGEYGLLESQGTSRTLRLCNGVIVKVTRQSTLRSTSLIHVLRAEQSFLKC